MTYQAFRKEFNSSRKLLMAGGVLVGVGGLLASAGVLLLSSATVSVTRRWMKQLERPPTEIARLKWQQARVATTAGARAWRSSSSTPPSSSVLGSRDAVGDQAASLAGRRSQNPSA
jgi:hypothetical protein